MFSIIDGVLLRPLPYEDPDTLVMLRADRGQLGLEGYPALSVTEVDAFHGENELFDGFGRIASHTIGLTAPGSREQVPAVTVSPELLEVLGVRPLLGRSFDSQADHYAKNGAFRSVLISYELWQHRYGGEADILGRDIDIYNAGRQVVGVIPPGFRLLLGPGIGVAPHHNVWIPAARDPSWQHVRA